MISGFCIKAKVRWYVYDLRANFSIFVVLCEGIYSVVDCFSSFIWLLFFSRICSVSIILREKHNFFFTSKSSSSWFFFGIFTGFSWLRHVWIWWLKCVFGGGELEKSKLKKERNTTNDVTKFVAQRWMVW